MKKKLHLKNSLVKLGAFFGKLLGTICGFFAGIFRAPR